MEPSKRKKTVEETYQKKTPIEHILLRPDTYIGSIEREPSQMYVWDDNEKKIKSKNISYVPGLYKIFDEIIVNAADNKIRDKNMDKIKVDINKELKTISVFNNGQGIPVKIHAKEKVYVPELIFGNLLTSSNYDDKEKKVTGGRNGYGAKLCNIFSEEFIVETADQSVGLKYFQRYRKNMSEKEDPVIKPYIGPDYTKITFKPDFKRFGMDGFDDDILELMYKRVYDLAGILKNVYVYLNGEKIPVRNFKEYIQLYTGSETKIVHEIVNDRWEIAFTASDEQFQQVSFVNSICTSKGGTHVNHVMDQIIEPLIELVKRKEKGISIKPFQVKNCCFIFINSLIENPAFDSQTKENLTLRVASFGSKCKPSDKFIKEIGKTDIIEKIVSMARAKQSQDLKRTDGSKTTRLSGMAKLDDANYAGTKQSPKCSLILTEGDSAKTMAISGLSVVDRGYYGVFPLRGKLLNVREATHKQIMENAEINNIKKILGLQHGKVYESVESLRYGHVIIMTDQDFDGSHIKGLLINMFDYFFPSLLKIPEFLQVFITPIVRATRNKQTVEFFTIPEYEQWKAQNNNAKGWHIKYYKGLGTSTSEDAKRYFSDLNKHIKSFNPMDNNDKEMIDLAFNKKKADSRKTWLANFEPGTFLDNSQPKISITDFVNRELILFSMADNIRSIPSVVDGMKPGQRKVLFACFKRNLRQEMKVAQLAGYVAEHSAYHHGEASLCSTIVNLAQKFVGSNNINLLMPEGQFGSRIMGGKDASSARYISTRLSELSRIIFNEKDDPLLKFLNEDNQSIEPDFYVPIIPMVLVNGADGIGTGWSTSIPNYNPIDIVRNIYNLMEEKELNELTPYYRGFTGNIELQGDKFKIDGELEIHDDELVIKELPVGVWTQNYKEFLVSLQSEGVIKDIYEYHTERTVYFLIKFPKEKPPKNKEALKKKFKLSTTISINNIVCFDERGKIRKYTINDIQRDFYRLRLDFYLKRKEYHLKRLQEQLIKVENKVRFIKAVVDGELIVQKRKTAVISLELEQKNYLKIEDSYDYLLNMSIKSMTVEKIDELQNEYENMCKEYQLLLKKTPNELWREDLEVFIKEYEKMAANEDKILRDEIDNRKGIGNRKKKSDRKTVSFKVPKVKKVVIDDSSDDDKGDRPWEKY
ncbi:DNA topoisomerase 2 [Dictyocoela muelleri]|nr:DNA topoisomerase 2 [Dictyocoela muelleri]